MSNRKLHNDEEIVLLIFYYTNDIPFIDVAKKTSMSNLHSVDKTEITNRTV